MQEQDTLQVPGKEDELYGKSVEVAATQANIAVDNKQGAYLNSSPEQQLAIDAQVYGQTADIQKAISELNNLQISEMNDTAVKQRLYALSQKYEDLISDYKNKLASGVPLPDGEALSQAIESDLNEARTLAAQAREAQAVQLSEEQKSQEAREAGARAAVNYQLEQQASQQAPQEAPAAATAAEATPLNEFQVPPQAQPQAPLQPSVVTETVAPAPAVAIEQPPVATLEAIATPLEAAETPSPTTEKAKKLGFFDKRRRDAARKELTAINNLANRLHIDPADQQTAQKIAQYQESFDKWTDNPSYAPDKGSINNMKTFHSQLEGRLLQQRKNEAGEKLNKAEQKALAQYEKSKQ